MKVPAPSPAHAEGRQGHYAGAASRLLAFAVDIGVLWGIYTLGAGAVSLGTQLVTGNPANLRDHQLVAWIVFVMWGFAYFSYQWALGGRTIGMALFGLRVVQASGAPATTRQAVIRTLTLPISLVFLGVGLIIALVQRERRALHDLIAGTAVVYSWDARAARLRWLSHRHHPTNLGGNTPDG